MTTMKPQISSNLFSVPGKEKAILKFKAEAVGLSLFFRRRGGQSRFNNSLSLPEVGEIYDGRLYAKELAADVGRPGFSLDKIVGGGV